MSNLTTRLKSIAVEIEQLDKVFADLVVSVGDAGTELSSKYRQLDPNSRTTKNDGNKKRGRQSFIGTFLNKKGDEDETE